jgi:predicted transcriptional regulator
MDILQLVRSDLKGASIERQKAVAQGAGVPWSTLRKIVDADTENPRYDTVQLLTAYYERNPPEPRADAEVST